MPVNLYHGPAGSFKTKAIINKLAPQGIDHLLFVGAQNAVSDNHRHLWFNKSEGHGNLLKNNFLTCDHFLLKWLKINEPRVHFVSALFVRTVIRRILVEKKHPFFDSFKNNVSAINEICSTLTRLYQAGLNAYRAEQFFRGNEALSPVIALMKDYENLMKEKHSYDSGLLTTALLEKLEQSDFKWFEHIKTIVFDRFFPMGPGLREIIFKLAKVKPELNIIVSYSMDYDSTENIHLYYSYTALGEIADHQEYFHLTKTPSPILARQFHYPSQELHYIVSEITALLASGIPASDISILLPLNPDYHQRIHYLLDLYQIPHGGIMLPPMEHQPAKTAELVALWKSCPLGPLEDKLRLLKAASDFDDEWDFISSFLLDGISEDLVDLWKIQEYENKINFTSIPQGGISVFSFQQVATQETKHLFIAGFSQENIFSLTAPKVIQYDKLTQPEMIEIFGNGKYKVELLKKQWQDIINRNNGVIKISYPQFNWQNTEQTPPHLLLGEPHIVYQHALESKPPAPTIVQHDFPRLKQDAYSISEIETYFKCPFQFYARYCLKLDEWIEDTPDIQGHVSGLLIHRVLDKLYGENQDLFVEALNYELYLKRFKDLASTLVTKIVANDFNIKKSPSVIVADYTKRATDTLGKLIDFEVKQIKDKVKSTRPFAFEWAFGKGKTPPLTLTQNNQMITISGRIDRIDIDRKNGFFSVIDYKTGDLSKGTSIKNGLSPQLPLYMMVVQKHLLPELTPTSGILMGLKEVGKNSGLVIEGTPEEKLLWRSYKITFDEWQDIQDLVVKNIFLAHEHINQGDFAPQPRSANECSKCGFSHLCHFKASEMEVTE